MTPRTWTDYFDQDQLRAHQEWARQRAGSGRLVLEARDFRGAELAAAELTGVRLVRCDLTNARLVGAALTEAECIECRFGRANLREAYLNCATLEKCDFSFADLTEAEVSAATITGGTWGEAVLLKSNLAKAALSGTDLHDAHLEEANLTKASIFDACLRGAFLDRALVTFAHLQRVDLRNASIERMELTGTNLTECALHGARGTPSASGTVVLASIDLSPEYDASVVVGELPRADRLHRRRSQGAQGHLAPRRPHPRRRPLGAGEGRPADRLLHRRGGSSGSRGRGAEAGAGGRMSPGKENDVHRLLDIVVEEVSLVDRAANKRRFLVVKRSDPELACPAPAHAAGRRDDRAPEPHAARPAGAHPAGADLRHRRCGRRRFNCVKAIPDALGPPPDPTVLAAALPALSAKVAKLLRLVPQLSLPLLVVGLIDLLIDALGKAKRELQHLQAQMTQLAGVLDRARDLDDPGLLAIAVGAQANVNQEAANVG